MKITVKLFATLRNNREKIMEKEYADGTTPGDVLDDIGIGKKAVAIIMVNGRHSKVDLELKDQDVVSFFPPVGGG